MFWPCPSADHAGTPRMFLDAFATPDGRARFHVVEHRGAAEQPDDDYPVHLTTGRVLAQYQSGAQTRRVRELTDTGAFVEMHPMLAATDRHRRRRAGPRSPPAAARWSPRPGWSRRSGPDTVFVPFHWVGANQLTNDALDPASRMPEFKVCAAAWCRA